LSFSNDRIKKDCKDSERLFSTMPEVARDPLIRPQAAKQCCAWPL